MFLSDTGICPSLLPLVAVFFVCDRKKTEVRVYTLVMTLLLSLPLIRSGMNGFRYMDVRWGEIPALLLCFLCVDMCCGLPGRIEKKQVIRGSVVAAVYIILSSFGWFGIAALWLTLTLLFTIMPFSDRVLSGISGFFAGIAGKIAQRPTLRKLLRLILICIGGTVLLIYIAYLIRFSLVNLWLLLAAAGVIGMMWLFLVAKKYVRSAASLLTVCLIVTTCVYMADNGSINKGIFYILKYGDNVEENMLNTYADIENGNGTFGRTADFTRDITSPAAYVPDEDTDQQAEVSDENDSTVMEMMENDYIPYLAWENKSLIFDKPVLGYFRSLINKDLMLFLKRCGQDHECISANVNQHLFSHKEVLFSYFGVNTLYSDKPIENYFGMDQIQDGYENGDLMFVYRNRYALPVGVTYDTAADKERFNSFSADVLPYAVMNEMYFEGLDIPAGMKRSSTEYAKRCSFTTEKKLRGTTSHGMTCYDHTVTLNDDVSDSFLYITFTGVDEKIRSTIQMQLMMVHADREMTYSALIHNSYADYNWKFPNDTYTISLGYHENDVNMLEFAAPFNYEDFYISAVPRSVYTDAYDSLTREKLEDPQLSTNTLTGHITVSEEKMLSVNLVYLKGWKAYVDGQQVPIYKANGLFMGLMLEPGTHDIRFEYTTHLLPEGLILSGVSIVLFIVTAIICRRKNRKQTM